MPTPQELHDLMDYVNRMLPDRQQIANMQQNASAGAVQFDWYTRHFIVMPTLSVFELRGQSLMLTCSSILMQAALQTRDRNTKVAGEIVETLRTAEKLMPEEQIKGLALLVEARKALQRLAKKQDSNGATSPKSAPRL